MVDKIEGKLLKGCGKMRTDGIGVRDGTGYSCATRLCEICAAKLEQHRETKNAIMSKVKENIVEINGWQGKSSIDIEEYCDRIFVIKYQRQSKDDEPKMIKKEVLKSDLERLKAIIRRLFFTDIIIEHKDGENFIKSRHIACNYYSMLWDDIFSDRKKHNMFTIMMNVLDKQGFVRYSGGKVYKP